MKLFAKAVKKRKVERGNVLDWEYKVEEFFDIRYEFDKQVVLDTVDELVEKGSKGYICVADGVTLAMSRKCGRLREILDNSILNTCDSGWVPVYLKMIYGIERRQYCGTELLLDVVNKKKYNMLFMGSSNAVLEPLRKKLIEADDRIGNMTFVSLPFRHVEHFDYEAIARQIREEVPDIIWVSLGMPKQEQFMYSLLPLIEQGVMIGVGAAFRFASGLPNNNRAPRWMIQCKIEWLYRIFKEPKKQIGRCLLILRTAPGILLKEYKKK